MATLNRWQKVEKELEDGRRASEARTDTSWASWTGRFPLSFCVGFLTLAALFAVLGVTYRAHDTPLRRPDLPTVSGTVVERHQGKRASATVRYSAEGRDLTMTFRWGEVPPALGASTRIRFVPGSPERARPAGSAWDPGYQTLLGFAVVFVIVTPIGYVGGVLDARRRIRKRAAASATPVPGTSA